MRDPRWWMEIAAFVTMVVADAVGWLPISQTLWLLPLIWLALRWRRIPWARIGWRWPPHAGRVLVLGIVAGILLELLAVHVTTPAISAYFGVEPDYSGFRPIVGNAAMLALYLALSWTLAAFGEEICFRGYLMARLAHAFGEDRRAWIVSLILSSVLFGWGHTEQGVAGWVQEGLSGLLLGLLFLGAGRNLMLPIVAHGVSNTLAFVLIYLERYPGLH
jgi:membrane protease YdiL (CAAX protease family)